MELRYTQRIEAPRETVWTTMLTHGTYEKWVAAFMEGSTFRGDLVKDAEVDFYAPGHGGTRARLRVVDPPSRLEAEHVAVLDAALEVDPANEMATKWNGSIETYVLHDRDDATDVEIVMETDEAFREMLDSGWPRALELLKGMCERH